MTPLVKGRFYDTLDDARRADAVELRQADVETAKRHPLYGRLTPMPGRLLTTRPHRRVSNLRTDGGIELPEMAERHMDEWGFEVTILAIGPGVTPDVCVGSRVLVPQFAGVPLLDLETCAGIDLWIIGEGEIMALLHDAERRFKYSCGVGVEGCPEPFERAVPVVDGAVEPPTLFCANCAVVLQREAVYEAEPASTAAG